MLGAIRRIGPLGMSGMHWGAGRECKHSCVSMGIGGIRELLGGVEGVKGIGAVRECRGVRGAFGGWQGM